MGGLGRPGEPVVGSPTHPVMPNLVVLWKISPLRGRCSEVMRSAQGGRKMLLFSTSSLRLGVWWVVPGGLVRKIARLTSKYALPKT
jgi:hypothetical protein